MKLVCFIQARMSSKRFPNKALVKIKKKEILKIIYEKIKRDIKKLKIVILTSKDKRDEKIVNFCLKNKYSYFTGSLNNVYERYKSALKKNKIDAFIRITGDSPLINVKLLKKMIQVFKRSNSDIVTNVFPRSFPIGQSIEIINKNVFFKVNSKKLSKFHREHITSYFYKNPLKYNILNIKNKRNLSKINLSINTKKDLKKLKKKIYEQI